MLTDRERLTRQKSRPFLVELHRKLSRLGSTLTVMNTGAHPDDEISSMLAAMRFGLGMHVVVLCSTRGEGGQNSIGPERTGALGVLRSRELEEAMKVLDADISWVGFGPDDPVHDFGFSKNGTDTLERWGRERVIERMVRAYRTHRPDIVIPTFLDVPGQHGHHRAMTEAAEAAIALAADPEAYPEHFGDGLTPWRVDKYYLPAWSGGGATYDDEVPPPDATVTFEVPGRDTATGASWTDIGEWSRAGHATQGMGFWTPGADERWPLHLKIGPDGTETAISDTLPATLSVLAERVGAQAGEALLAADDEIGQARSAFPDRDAIVAALVRAVGFIETAEQHLEPDMAQAHGHRLARKRAEIDEALFLSAGIAAEAWAAPSALAPGASGTLHLRIAAGDIAVTATPLVSDNFSVGAAISKGTLVLFPLTAHQDAPIANSYPAGFSALQGNGTVAVKLSARIGGHEATLFVDLEEPVEIVPIHSVRLEPDVVIVPVGKPARLLDIAVRVEPEAKVELGQAAGIAVSPTPSGFAVTPQALAPGLHRLSATAGKRPAYRVTPISYPHVGRLRHVVPAELSLLALDLALPESVKVGYVGGGSDRIGMWLRRMGLDVDELDTDALGADLGRYTSIVVGTLAYGTRPDLLAARSRINDWVDEGGHLVSLYHRPHDGWEPQQTPPRRLVIGSPSLRWRVTDPTAPVTVLAPEHKLLAGPNRIGADDFAGWDKERGLYFAAEWDDAYTPLLSMHDKGEPPLTGALLSATVGDGRHTHVSLVLHHQMDRLVPGSFRIMANLVQPA